MRERTVRILFAVGKTALLGLALVGFVIYPNVLYPDVFTKGLYVRFLILVALTALVWLALGRRVSLPRMTPLLWALAAFFALAVASMALSPGIYRSFWGEAQRMEGLFGLLHYGALFLAARALFTPKDYLRYFKLITLTLPPLVLYAVLQWISARANVPLPFVVNPAGQPGSLFGNPAFFSVFLIFGAGFALFVYAMESARGWKVFSAAAALLSLLAIMWVGVRGEMLGAAAGALVFLGLSAFWDGARKYKIAFFAVCAALLVSGGALYALRGAYFDAYPRPIQRLVNLPHEPSFETRRLSLESSVKAWLHSPKTALIGWGGEHFMTGYNLYYDARHGSFEDAWFDRAHNRVADALVTGGALGTASYLGLFAVVVAYLVGLGKDPARRGIAIAGGALLAAYFAENLTLFDMPHSYANFFLLMAFVDGLRYPAGRAYAPALSDGKGMRMGAWAGGLAATAVAAFLLVFAIVIPLRQSARYLNFFRAHEGDAFIANAEKIFRPQNFAHYTLTDDFWRRLRDQDALRDPALLPLSNLLVQELRVIADRELYDAQTALKLANVYTERAIGLAEIDPEKSRKEYALGETYVRRAIARAPTRQENYYLLAFNLQGQGRGQEAVEAMRYAVSLNPGTVKARYVLGINLALAGDPASAVTVIEEVRLAGWFHGMQEREVRNIERIYTAAGRRDLLPDLMRSVLEPGISKAPEHFVLLIRELIAREERAEVIRWANAYAHARPEVTEDMGRVVQFAEEGRWDILKQL